MPLPIYTPKVGDEILFHFFNVPEQVFYGEPHLGVVTRDNGNKTYRVHVESGYTYDAIKQMEIIHQVVRRQFTGIKEYASGRPVKDCIHCDKDVTEVDGETQLCEACFKIIFPKGKVLFP